MADRITLKLELRKTLGKEVKKLRRLGIVPVHLYGPGITPFSLQCQGPELIRALARAGGNTPVTLTIEGQQDEHLAFVREIQWDPVKGDLFHVDFLRAEATQRVSAEVPVLLVGESSGAKESNGTVVQQLRSVTIEALPFDMPQDLKADLSTLVLANGVIRVGDLELPPGATLLTGLDDVVVRIEAARVEEVVEQEPEVQPTDEGQESEETG